MDWYEDWRASGSRGVSEMNDWKRKVQERDRVLWAEREDTAWAR